jgi:competence protein ComEA
MSAALRLLLLASFVLAAAATARAGRTGDHLQSSGKSAAAFPALPGRDVAVRICLDCHPTSDIANRRESRFKWAVIVEEMIGEGAKINDRDFETVTAYLSVAFGRKVRINEAPAKVIAETFDIAAEDADRIVRRRTERGPFKSWQEIAAVPGIDAKRVEEQQANLDFTAGLRLVPLAPAAPVSSGAVLAPRR